MNIGEWLQLAVWDVKAFLGDDDSRSHAEALRAVNSQKTPEDKEIYQTVESARIEHGGIVGVVRGLVGAAGQGLGSLFKMLILVLRFFPLILIVFFILYLTFYLKIFQKVKP